MKDGVFRVAFLVQHFCLFSLLIFLFLSLFVFNFYFFLFYYYFISFYYYFNVYIHILERAVVEQLSKGAHHHFVVWKSTEKSSRPTHLSRFATVNCLRWWRFPFPASSSSSFFSFFFVLFSKIVLFFSILLSFVCCCIGDKGQRRKDQLVCSILLLLGIYFWLWARDHFQ